MKRPEIHHFADYRTFLLAYARERKAKNPQWSLSVWAKRLSLKSPSGITRVLKGDRAPSRDLTEKLIRYFEFGARDAEYFKQLIRITRSAHDSDTTAVLLQRLAKVHPIRDTRQLDVDAFHAIASWYPLSIRELVKVRGFREDPAWIRGRLRFELSDEQVREAIDRLIALGLLDRDESGRLRQTSTRLNVPGNVRSEAVRSYHAQMLDNAKVAQHQTGVDEKDYRGTTIAMRVENVPKLKALITDFHRRVAELVEEESGNTVYQFQSQLFQITVPLAAGEGSDLRTEIREAGADECSA